MIIRRLVNLLVVYSQQYIDTGTEETTAKRMERLATAVTVYTSTLWHIVKDEYSLAIGHAGATFSVW